MTAFQLVIANAVALHAFSGLLLLDMLLKLQGEEDWSLHMRAGLSRREPAAIFAGAAFVGFWPIFYLLGIWQGLSRPKF